METRYKVAHLRKSHHSVLPALLPIERKQNARVAAILHFKKIFELLRRILCAAKMISAPQESHGQRLLLTRMVGVVMQVEAFTGLVNNGTNSAVPGLLKVDRIWSVNVDNFAVWHRISWFGLGNRST